MLTFVSACHPMLHRFVMIFRPSEPWLFDFRLGENQKIKFLSTFPSSIVFLINLALNLSPKTFQKSSQQASKIDKTWHSKHHPSWLGIWSPLGSNSGGWRKAASSWLKLHLVIFNPIKTLSPKGALGAFRFGPIRGSSRGEAFLLFSIFSPSWLNMAPGWLQDGPT